MENINYREIEIRKEQEARFKAIGEGKGKNYIGNQSSCGHAPSLIVEGYDDECHYVRVCLACGF